MIFGTLVVALLLFSGCGDGDIETATEEPIDNSAIGTVRQFPNVVKEEHLHSHYYGEPGGEEEGKHILMLQKGAYDPQVGQAIVFGRTDQFPNGLMRKIEAIYEHDDKTKIVSSQAALDDIFEDLEITHSMKLKPLPILDKTEKNVDGSDVIRILYEKDGVSLSQKSDIMINSNELAANSEGLDFHVNFNEVVLKEGVTLNGHLDMSLEFHFKLSFNKICIRHVLGQCVAHKTVLGHTYFYIEPRESGQVSLSATKSGQINKEVTLAEYSFSPIDIQVGIIPVIIVPKLSFIVGGYGEVTAGISMGCTEDLSSKIGLTYKKKQGYSNHHWYSIKDIVPVVDWIPPNFDATGEVKISTGPFLELLIYDITGPTANLDTYIEADVDLKADPWWTLYYGVEANAGFILDVLGHDFAEVTFDIYNYQNIIAHSDGAFEW